MAEVKVRYNNSDIAAIQKPGGMTLQTAGKYMGDNVEVQYTDPNPNVIQDQDGYLVLSDQAGGSTVDFDEFLAGSVPIGVCEAKSTTIVRAWFCNYRTEITALSSNTITDIRERAFYYCSNLEEVYLPNLVYLRNGTGTNQNADGYIFYGCSKLRSFYAPNLEYVYGNWVFGYACAPGSVFAFPKLKIAGTRMFRSSNASVVDFGEGVTYLYADTFYSGSNKTVILRNSDAVVTASSADTIQKVTVLYVHQSLISDYQSASNWSARYTAGTITINAIEGSQYENYYADGTLISTT